MRVGHGEEDGADGRHGCQEDIWLACFCGTGGTWVNPVLLIAMEAKVSGAGEGTLWT